MTKVLLVVPGLQPGGAAKQVALLAPGLVGQGFEPRVAVLGPDGPFGRPLRAAEVPVEVLGPPRLFRLALLPRLLGLLRSWRPQVVHAWGPAAFRLATVATLSGLAPHLVVSAPLGHEKYAGVAGWLDGMLLRGADRIAARGPAEAGRLLRAGVREDRVVFLPPAVAGAGPASVNGIDVRRTLGLAPGTTLIACVGPLERRKGFGDAVWSFNMLASGTPDVYLVVIGVGPDRPRLGDYARWQGTTNRVRFLGLQDDVAALLHQVDVVWVPSLDDGGVNVALEALAAGRPVVASRTAALAEILADGRVGFLVAPRDKAALAGRTRALLRDPELRRRHGEAGKERAATFAVADQVRRLAGVYRSVLGAAAQTEDARRGHAA
jgi:glycosyltransferase involved in cell wall biosynthesis